MTPQNQLEIHGKIAAHPFAELIAEIGQATLSGSLRVASGPRKTMVYFAEGVIVYAASNSRQHRLFDILLRAGTIGKQELANHPNFANDVEFAGGLVSSGIVTQDELSEITTKQIEAVIIDALTWPDGEWLFNPLARPRADLIYRISAQNVLLDYGRCIHSTVVADRFESMDEQFALLAMPNGNVNLLQHETFLLAQFGDRTLSINELRQTSNMPESGILQALYSLWIGGFLARNGWNAAFSVRQLEAIRTAKLQRVKEARTIDAPKAPAPEFPADELPTAEPVKIPDAEISLDDYLARSETAKSHYERLGIESDTPLAQLKISYFGLAKLFHPDRFHRESPELLRRIQVAFTELSHAYETLRDQEARNSYDYKLRKEAESEAKRRAEGKSEIITDADKRAEQGSENFEAGLSHLDDDDYESAAKCFARAVHFMPQNARYHAYYGKALSAFDKMRHKAESELQSAANMQPQDSEIRLMLVQFFIDMNLLKRAEGELNRYLQIAPGDAAAQKLLAGLRA